MTTNLNSIESIRGKATIPIWPDAAGILGLSRNSAFKAAAEGTLPTLRFGKRLVVPVPKLLAMLEPAPDVPGVG